MLVLIREFITYHIILKSIKRLILSSRWSRKSRRRMGFFSRVADSIADIILESGRYPSFMRAFTQDEIFVHVHVKNSIQIMLRNISWRWRIFRWSCGPNHRCVKGESNVRVRQIQVGGLRIVWTRGVPIFLHIGLTRMRSKRQLFWSW